MQFRTGARQLGSKMHEYSTDVPDVRAILNVPVAPLRAGNNSQCEESLSVETMRILVTLRGVSATLQGCKRLITLAVPVHRRVDLRADQATKRGRRSKGISSTFPAEGLAHVR